MGNVRVVSVHQLYVCANSELLGYITFPDTAYFITVYYNSMLL